MRGPHPGCQTLAADVTQGKDYAAARLLYGEKVTGQVANGENFAGNFEVAVPDQTGSAQTAVHLRSFEECGVQIGVILLKLPRASAPRWRLPEFWRGGEGLDIDCTPCPQTALESWLTHNC